MNGEPGAFARGLSKVKAGFDAFVGRPAAFQLASVASVLLVLGALLPWITYGGDFVDGEYVLGVEGTPGALTILTGVTVLVVLARQRVDAAAGYLAALGLLATLLVGAQLIHMWDTAGADPGFGMYVSGAAAVVLLLSGIALYGGAAWRDRPPD